MLASILRAAGLRATSAGNVGTPLLEAVLHPEPYDVLAVELSSFQLHWQRSVRPVASVCLNLAPDHIDWHGSLEQYRQAKAKVYTGTQVDLDSHVQSTATPQMVKDAYGVAGTFDVHIRPIRSKGGAELSRSIETVRNVGYLWNG